MMIKNLQNKSEPVKRLIMWFGIVLIMAVIFIFWLSNFSSPTLTPDGGENLNLDKLPGVWQSFKDQLNGLNILWPK